MAVIHLRRQYDESYRQRHSNLSSGSIVGIVIAIIAAAMLATFFGVVYFEHRKNSQRRQQNLPQIRESKILKKAFLIGISLGFIYFSCAKRLGIDEETMEEGRINRGMFVEERTGYTLGRVVDNPQIKIEADYPKIGNPANVVANEKTLA